MALWFEATLPADSKQKALVGPQRGKEGAEQCWGVVKSQDAKNKDVPYELLATLKPFAFLLDVAERPQLKALSDKHAAKQGPDASVMPTGVKFKKRRSQSYDVEAEVASLFKKVK